MFSVTMFSVTEVAVMQPGRPMRKRGWLTGLAAQVCMKDLFRSQYELANGCDTVIVSPLAHFWIS